eukprot:Gb_36171 [translate_table: standard]
MRPFSAISKAAIRLVSHQRQRLDPRYASVLLQGGFNSKRPSEILRQFSNIAGIDARGGINKRNWETEGILTLDKSRSGTFIQQTRGFLGCGDGDEDTGLSKTYEEKRVLGYSPEQLFAVVAAVDLYEDFVPWCQRSRVLQRKSDEAFDAELQIGFKFLVERYISHVELKKPRFIKTTVSESNLFDYLINIWEFNNGPIPGSCELHFFVDFQFHSPLYRQVANMFFKEVVSQLVASFEQRCHKVYGPGVKILESAYGIQRV